MGKYLTIFLVGLILSVFSFFPYPLGLAGNMGVYTGTLNYICTEGDQPTEKIVFQFEENMGNTLMVYREPTGWDCIHYGDRIELRNGHLNPGVPIPLIMSCKCGSQGSIVGKRRTQRSVQGAGGDPGERLWK